MKALYVNIFLILLFIASSCGSGFYMASSYVDDAYYNPADRQVIVEKRVVVEDPVVNEIEEQDAILEEAYADLGREYYLVDSLSEQLYDDEGNLIVNNHYYYEAEQDLDYTNRINRFHRPGMTFGYYDSWFWDDYYWDSYWYSPFGYSSWSNFYSPWSYRSMYSPWYSSWYNPWYYPGYYSYSSWYYPYDYYYGSGYNYGKGWSATKNSDNHYYGHRNSGVTDGPGSFGGSATKSDLAQARSVNSPRTGITDGGQKGVTGNSSEKLQTGTTSRTVSQAERKIESSERGASGRSGISSYNNSRSGTTYARPPVRTSRDLSTARSSQSTYVRPKTSTTSRSAGSALSGSGVTSRSSSTAVRSSSSSSGRTSTYRSSSGTGTMNNSSLRSSSGTAVRSSSSGVSSSRSSSSGISSSSRSSGSSSGSVSRSSSSGSSSSSSSSRGGGGKR